MGLTRWVELEFELSERFAFCLFVVGVVNK